MGTIYTRSTSDVANNITVLGQPLTNAQMNTNLASLVSGKVPDTVGQNRPNIDPTLNLDFTKGKLDPRVTFTRASSATYYDGKTSVMAEQNLVLQSQTFTTSPWNTGVATLTPNSTTAPDGSNTATTMTETSTTNYHYNQQTINLVSGQTYTLSAYALNLTGTYFGLFALVNANIYAGAYFDISAGTLKSSNAIGTGWSIVGTPSIVSVGNGWYRCSITFVCGTTGTNTIYLSMSNDGTSYGAYGGSYYLGTGRSIYIWGAQLEQRANATAYIVTTSTAITNYIPVLQTAPINTPRFDYNPVTGENKGVLLEGQSTNLYTYSQQFNVGSWVNSYASVINNIIIAPDGTLTGNKLIEDTTNNQHNIYQNITATASVTYNFTIYAKAGERQYLTLCDSQIATRANFDLINGIVTVAISGPNATITPVGNGWFRCSMQMTTATTGNLGYAIGISNIGSSAPVYSVTYQGNGYSGLYLWGAQLEALAFPTSYIPTVASQITRNDDISYMNITNPSYWYIQGQGSVYCEFQRPSSGGYSSPLGFAQSASAVANSIDIYSPTSTSIYTQIASGGSYYANIYGLLNSGTYNKLASSWGNNAALESLNGLPAITGGGSIPTNIDIMRIGKNRDGSIALNGWIKKLTYYPQVLPTQQLQSLTT